MTHWSSRLLADHLGVSDFTITTTWKKWGLQPWRIGDVQVLHRPRAGGQDPRRRRPVPEPARQGDRAVRGREVANPGAGPDRADPASAARASRRSRPTTTSGTAPPPCSPRWRSPPGRSPTPATRGTATRSSCASSNRSRRPTRGRSCTRAGQLRHAQTPDVTPGWRSNPRITLHFTPTSGSWLNMVEIFFGIITRQAIRRGTFTSVKDLIAAIGDLHRRLERPLPTLRLDQDRRPIPHQEPTE